MTNKCPCCGRSAGDLDRADTTSRPRHWVDADVLALVNAAHAEAEARGAPQVDLVHLLIVLTTTTTYEDVLESAALDRHILRAVVLVEADADRRSGPMAAVAPRPRTSRDVRLLLDLAERTAAIFGSRVISLQDVVATLAAVPASLEAAPSLRRWFFAARACPDAYARPRRPHDQTRHSEDRGTRAWRSAQSASHHIGGGWPPTQRDAQGSSISPRSDRPDERPSWLRFLSLGASGYDLTTRANAQSTQQTTASQPTTTPPPAPADQHTGQNGAPPDPAMAPALERLSSRSDDEASSTTPRTHQTTSDGDHHLANAHAEGFGSPNKLRQSTGRRFDWDQESGRIAGSAWTTSAGAGRHAGSVADKTAGFPAGDDADRDRGSPPRDAAPDDARISSESVLSPASLGHGKIVRLAKSAHHASDDFSDDDAIDPDHEPDPELEKLGVKRYYLSLDDDIVRAPSIGPRTAERLRPHGLTHVKHLLACEPERVSARLGARHLTASRIAAWKDQARLVCTIPWLRGTHAQLLVGAGYASIEKILSTERSQVCAAIMQFATTRDGQAILRGGTPPELDRIMRWIENSQQAEPLRAQWGKSVLN